MVDRGNKDGHRHRMSGLKVEETEKWGRQKAYERYGSPQSPNMKPKDEHGPQSKENQHGPNYSNDTSGWVRAAGESGKPKR
jgi:hypothetical protein